jgi:predicted nucleic acid-binding Zn ribbon protein
VSEKRPAPDECANCGATIPRHARACPECGADERSGWREPSVYDGLNLPDSAYDDTPRRPARHGLPWYWIVTALVLIGVALFISIGRA